MDEYEVVSNVKLVFAFRLLLFVLLLITVTGIIYLHINEDL